MLQGADPVGAFEKIRESLILYIKTAFGTQVPSFEAEREQLLRQPGVLCQEPWPPAPIAGGRGVRIGAGRDDSWRPEASLGSGLRASPFSVIY
jgi:hypothetical protein